MIRSLLPLILLVAAPGGLQAGLIQVWQLKETAAAPVIVVGRILDVQKQERVPEGSLPWKAAIWRATADVRVLRSRAESGEPLPSGRLRVDFLAYDPSPTLSVNGNPPPLPAIERDAVLILPLKGNRPPDSENWQLMADSGTSLVIPARAEMPQSASPADARAFLNREIVNALASGDAQLTASIARYLSTQHEDLTAELMPLLKAALGDDRDQWVRVAAGLLAGQGSPRPTVVELLSEKFNPGTWKLRPSLLLARTVMQSLQGTPELDTLLIRRWIADAPWQAWGSANCLLEYADHPITAQALGQALRDDLAGSSYIAWTLAHAGHPVVLEDSLARALRVADRPAGDLTDLQGAAALLRDFGSDRDLKQLASLVAKYRTADPKFYGVLWQYATEAGNPREARVLAVVLLDRHSLWPDMRYCDFAVGVLQRAVHEDFGVGGKTLKERDEAVSRALAWVRSHGFAN